MKHTQKYALYDTDIKKIMGGRVNIIPYYELKHYSSIDHLTAPYGQVVILYMTSHNSGHYTCIINHNDRIEFFDSYSNKPDHEFDDIQKDKIKKHNYSGYPYLLKLLKKSNKTIEFNHHQLQKDGNGVATCGRWVVLRMLLKDVPLDTFINIFKKFSDPDEIVTKLTNNFLL